MTPTDHHREDRPAEPTVAEIAALTARLRMLSTQGRNADPAERAAFLADKDALLARIPGAEPTTPDRTGELHEHRPRPADTEVTPTAARYWPPVGTVEHPDSGDGVDHAWYQGIPAPHPDQEAVSQAEAARRLEAIGYDRDSAEQMVTEYLHESSRAVGVPVYDWGLDQNDVEAIAERYRWVDHEQGQTLDDARAAAAQRAEQLAGIDHSHYTGSSAHVDAQARVWADRARTPDPFRYGQDDEHPDETTASAVAGAHHAVADVRQQRDRPPDAWQPDSWQDESSDGSHAPVREW